jgi:hypothetical protein
MDEWMSVRFSSGCSLTISPWTPAPIALAMENGGFLLFVQPGEKLLEPGIGQNDLDGIECVAEFVVTPSVVDEILT